MKLVTFNADTMPKMFGGPKSSIPRISFAKTGTISFNQPAMALIGISPGDKVSIAHEDDDAMNWYVFKDDKGFELRGKGDDGKGLTFNHSQLIKRFKELNDINEDESVKALIAGKPTVVAKVQYWGILIKPA